MYKIPLPELKEKIIVTGKYDSEKLDEAIKTKINELSGLISEEGAAHIIANELGVDLSPPDKGKLKIKEIYAGMRNISTVGKVVRKYEAREFKKGEGTGKVCSLILGDETGTTRVVFWNEQVEQLSLVNEDDILLLKNVYVRENNNNKEIHLGDKGEIEVNPADESVGTVRRSAEFERKPISSLEGAEQNTEILGTVVQVFDPRFFYICPQCNKRATEVEGNFSCAVHGAVEANLSYVMNAVVDDGTGNIRGVFWKNQTNHLLDLDEEKMKAFKEDMSAFENIKTDLLGEQFKLMGKVQKNDMFNRLEFVSQLVEKANPEEEMKNLEKVK
jgi:ssDNA-binding replication factor A large subunit